MVGLQHYLVNCLVTRRTVTEILERLLLKLVTRVVEMERRVRLSRTGIPFKEGLLYIEFKYYADAIHSDLTPPG